MPRHTVLHLSKQIERAGFTIMRIVTTVAVALFTTSGLIAAESAQASITHYELNIPRQSLDTALKDLAQQTGLQVGRFSDAVKGDTLVGPITGNYSADQALKSLLAPTRLTYRNLNDHAIIVLRAEDIPQLPPANTLSRSGGNEDSSSARDGRGQGRQGGEDSSQTNDHNSFWSRLRLAQTSQGSAQSIGSVNSASPPSNLSSATSSQGSSEPVRLEEVVVTAQKKQERLQDVPVPVTALSADALLENNQTRLQDYYSSVPGLNLALDNRGSPAIAVRGLTTTIYGNPTVATVVDDVPYSGSTSAAFSWAAAEFDPNELAQVEVLRGPQGVLYGASSLGGLIKFVTIKPSTAGFNARAQVSANSVVNGGSGFGASGAVNVPFADTFALRASGFHRHDPGYIDNVLSGQHDVNDADVDGGRLSTLWQASEDISLQVSALYQRTSTGGSPNIESQDVAGAQLADLQQSYVRNTGSYDRRLQAYTATLNAGLGSVDLASISGYAVSNSRGSFETSNLGFTQRNSGRFFGTPYTAWVEDNETRKFSQEVRLSGSVSHRVDWLVGGFYTDETTDLNGGFSSFQGAPSWSPLGAWTASNSPVTYKETAGFANLTPHVTDRLEIQFGVRYSKNDQTFEPSTSFGPAAPLTAGPKLSSSESATTYLVTPTFRFSRDLMIYGRIASGFRPGGINTAENSPTVHPQTFGPDKTQNYEVGLKGAFLDNRLSLNASLYTINWRDIQITISDSVTGETYAVNLGAARTRGAEVEFEARPSRGLTISGWAAFTDAKLTADFPPGAAAFGSRGDRLPYSSRFTTALSLQQEFPLFGSATGFGKLSVTHVGERQGEFASGFGQGRQIYPSYTTVDLLAGARFDSWTANLYANNVSDKRGVLAGGLGTLNSFSFTYIQPRTIGLSLSRSF